MLFNSGVFLQFFAAFLLLYYLVRNHLRARNVLIVLSSYLFYGWWDYRFLSLLIATSVLDFGIGRALDGCAAPPRRQAWLALSLAANLGLLGFCKYFNFFVDSAVVLLTQLGFHAEPRTLNIVLPVGISFYTFQSLSYAVDVYRRDIPATRDLVSFLAYVSFFPQLVAGPIERARHLLPQFAVTRVITPERLIEGAWLIVWGLFKKVVVADNLAPLVELVYDQPTPGGPLVVLGTVAFAFQIYGDFSGYSDMARGLATVLGFDLMVNFHLPYAATSPREFWRRWHISLSTWLRDYLYISLGGNRRGPGRTRLNLLLTMVLGGLWHGAAWNFVLWGCWHGLGLLLTRPGRPVNPSLPPVGSRPGAAPGGGDGARNVSEAESARLTDTQPPPPEPVAPHPRGGTWLAWGATMLFVLYGWLLFRAGSFGQIVDLTAALGRWSWPEWGQSYVINLAAFTLPLVLVQIWQARSRDLLAPIRWPAWGRAMLQGLLLLAIVTFWREEAAAFIYFQF